jgi:2-polyprenyl-6-methoxyphenol hydroxylase-like FAD-dependent oxidoreductase
MSTVYDAIVIGARCAGAPTGMLLARRGYRVLIVDRATFPSDTISTHVVHPLGVAALARWGVLDRLTATGCPPIHTYAFDFGPFTLSGSPGTDDAPIGLCPRRTILDKLLVDAAIESGAEVRERFIVEELVSENNQVVGIKGRTQAGTPVEERARIIVGADGRQSLVARGVGARQYHERPPLMCGYYSYWRGLPMNGRFETCIRPHRGCAAADTHDGLTLIVVGWPHAEFEANKKDVERHYLETIRLAPGLANRLDSATREAPIAGATIPNFFRTPYGPGWALVGDAGYNKDPITAQGIADAFRDAEHLATAIDEVFSGRRPFEAAMLAYQQSRDEHVLPMYEFTCQLATLAPPPPEMQQLFGSIHGNQREMDRFVQMNAGTISPTEFFMAKH